MKKFQENAIKCALALFAAANLAACSSNEEPEAPVNPTYDGNSVKTQFAINVATAGNGTRMSAGNTQNSSNYLGMENVRLLTFVDAPSATNTTIGSYIELATPTSVSTSRSSHIYKNVDILTGTKNFLFYSTRSDVKSTNSAADKFAKGSIISKVFELGSSFSGLNDVNFVFKGEKAITEDATHPISNIRTAFAGYLNGVDAALTSVINGLTDGSQVKTQLTSYQNGFRGKWSNVQRQRAGSADAILRQVQGLYANVQAIDGLSTEAKNTIKDAIAKEVKNEANNALFTIQLSGNTLSYTFTSNAAYKNFPVAQNLPEGTQILTHSDSKFQYVDSNPVIGGDNQINTQNIIYPLPIVYFDNTPARATDSDITTWQTTTANWNLDATWSGWGDAVQETTQSIALKNNINYGVAALKTTIKCDGESLEDNRKAYYDELDNQTIATKNGGYPVTGLLIGGQPQSVGWELVDATTEERNVVVYDKNMNNAKASNTESAAIYTLVFDNWHSKAQESVNIAIELENNSGQAFYGQDGIVEDGQKFYLIGKLDPASATTFTWPSYGTLDGNLPVSYQNCYPVKAGTNRVFIQDYTTTAKFTIKSLKNAYVTIPDLRATKLQLGISVDLKWEAGLTFNVEL